MKYYKTGQASFEFLATYSWILIAVLVTVGALFYFNILDPQRYMPDECEFGNNIICEDWTLYKKSSLSFGFMLKLKNNLEKPIRIAQVNVIDNDYNNLTCTHGEFVCPFDASFNNNNWTLTSPNDWRGEWKTGKSCTLNMTCEKSLVEGVKNTFLIDISFRRITPSDSASNHVISGRLFSKTR